MDTLKKHLPFSGPEGIHELKKIAERFEEKIYTAATSQSDYLRKISLKMLTMETKSQNTMPNQVNNSNRPPDQGIGSLGMQPQVHNQAQSLGMPLPPNQTQTRQQILPQNIPNPVGVQSSSSLSSGMPQTSSLTQNAMSNVNPSMQGVPANTQNSVGNPNMGQQGVPNMYANSQRQQMPGRQQVVNQQQQQQQPQNQQQYLYQQQLQQQQLMKPKFQNPAMLQSHMQQQQQQQNNLLQPNQLQPSQQQNMIQTSAPMQQQPSMMQTSLSGQNQVSSVQQQPKPMLQQQHPQAVHRQQQQQPQQMPQQQQQLIGQQANSASMQQSHMIGQQNNVGDMQQQQQQPQRMLGQQNNLSNIQQQLMAQQQNLSNLHQQQLGPQSNVNGLQQQQQMIGSQGGNSNMQTNQHSVHMLQQQSKPQLPQQQQQQQQSQQSQPQQQQQQQQMQQQLGGLQQQPNMPHRLQQSGQPTGPMLQSQNVMDQQKQMYQTQRAPPDTSSTQTGLANGGDWQEEIYQKIKQMKEQYLPELSEMYQKIATKLHQHDSIPHPPKSDQFEKLKLFRSMLERAITFLQITKAGIQPGYKEKLAHYEKQIINFINTNRPRKSGPQMQQGQLQSSHMHPMQQQPQSQMNQLQQSHDSQMNPQMQSMPAMQQNNNISTLQQNSMMDSGQGNSMNSMQQHVPEGSLQQQQTPANAPLHQQQTNNGMNVMQPNLTNPDMIRHPIIKQEQQQQQQQQQQILQNQQQYKQQFQHRQMQQQILQKQQQQQQQQQQAKQNQIHQLQQINDVNEMKTRQSMNVKPSVLQQQQQQQQRSGYSINQPMKSGSPFSMSSGQLLQASSPQLLQHSSPQVDQHIPKAGTPLQSANSPFVVPSPSTPRAPSPMPGDSEKPVPGVISLSNAAGIGGQQQMSSAVAPAQSLAIGTPGISASPLLAEFSGPDGTHGNALAAVSGKSSITELPLERLMKAVKSMSSKALSAAVSDIGSVVSMMDRIAGSAPGNGSRAAVGEDLVAMTKCRLQGRNFLTQENGTNGTTKKMKRYTSAVPLNVVSSASSVDDSFKQLTATESAELGSTATSSFKRPKLQANLALWEEIKEINQRLIDTVVDISDEETDSASAAAIVEGGEGTIVKCSFTAMALSPNLKSQYASARMSPIQPLRLLVPTNYPNCSPVLLDKIPVDFSKEYEDLSVKAKSRFSVSLRSLSQPMSLAAIARTWDVCARTVISEHAQITGGGSFSSKYGTWENCLSAA